LKTLTASLEAAQKAASSLPYVEALFADYDGYARRGRFTRHYSGAEPASPAAAAIAPDGSLVRLRRLLNAVTLEYQVAASADDAAENNHNVVVDGAQTLVNDIDEWVGVRFLGVALPQGATILRAVLAFVLATGNDDPAVEIFGNDVDDAATFTTATDEISTRAQTAASVVWDVAALGGDDARFFETPDIAAVVQEIVDRGGWASGQDMAFMLQAGVTTGDFGVHFFDGSPALAPRLTVTYATDDPPAEVFVSRVATPAPGSTFSSWSSLDDEVSFQGGVALAVDSDTLYAFVVDDDRVTLKVWTSTNHGASWTGPATVSAAGGEKTHLAAAAADDDDIVVFWAETDGIVYSSRWDGATWGARTAWTNDVYGVTGLAAAYVVDWQVLVCGQELATQDAKVYATRYGDGGNLTADTWGDLRELTAAFAGSGVSFAAPALGWEAGAWRAFFVESYAGDAAYDLLQWSTMALAHDFNEEQWREPGAFNWDGPDGVAIAISATRIWLVAAEGVWSSPLPANAELDVSAGLLEATVDTDARGSLVELELPVSYDAEAIVQRGARLQLTPGYRTSSDEAPLPWSYWVETVEVLTGPRPSLLVRARDGWWLLERWRARRQLVWAAGSRSVSQILLFLVARAGVEFTVEATSDALTALQPAFTVHPGESGLTAVRRLLALVEDVARWDGAELVTNATADDDVSTYELGGTGHAVVEAKYSDAALEVNRVRVLGLDVYAEANDFADAEAAGERSVQVIDVNLATSEEAADRAAAVLRKGRVFAELGELRLFGVHCGLELWDVVELTDAEAGLVAEPRRVNAYSWRYEPRRGRYDMQLMLGPV
jgi:hypothetical protein